MSPAESTTVRVSRADHDVLNTLARELNRSQSEILHDALELYRRDRLLEAMNQGFVRKRETAKPRSPRRSVTDGQGESHADGFSSGG